MFARLTQAAALILPAVVVFAGESSSDHASIRGRVVYESNSRPATGLTVRCIGITPGTGAYSFAGDVTTDKEGSFSIERVSPGSYSFSLLREPDTEWTHRDIRWRKILPGTNATVELRLEKGQMLDGKVVDAEETPVAGALIALQSSDACVRATSDTNGHFAIHLPTGQYRAKVEAAPHQYRAFVDPSPSCAPKYGEDVVATIEAETPPAPLVFWFYTVATDEPQCPPGYFIDPRSTATRHIVSWILGMRMPGFQEFFPDWRNMRKMKDLLLVCEYLPENVRVIDDPRIHRITRSDYDAFRRQAAEQRTTAILIQPIEETSFDDTRSFQVTCDYPNDESKLYRIDFRFHERGGVSAAVKGPGLE